jgi:ATP-binding cassette, subfamily B, bacterial PglK
MIDYSLKQVIVDVFKLLSDKEKKSFYKIGFIVLLMSIVEVIGIASILPFIKVLSNQNIIFENDILNTVFKYFNMASVKNFMILLGLFAFFSLLVANLVSIWSIKKMYTYIYSLNHSLASNLLESYLNKDYMFFVNKNSSALTKNIITEVEQTVVGMFIPIVNLMAKICVMLFVIIFLMYVNVKTTLIVFMTIGGGYFILYYFIKKRIAIEGKNRSLHNNLRYKATNEAFGAIKEIKLIGKEELFLNKFKVHSKIYASSMAHNAILGLIPKYMMEILAFGGIILSIVYMLIIDESIEKYIPLISIFVFAGYRMMPAMQQIFASFSKIRFSHKALYNLLNDYNIIDDSQKNCNKIATKITNIYLKNISFSYNTFDKAIIKDFSLEIKVGDKIAFIGPTGCGKTTLVDIILGLYSPSNGNIYINNTKVNNMKQWNNNIAYVPQFNYLLDDTIYSNVAFGEEVINKDKVKNVAKLACIDDVIENLEHGYDTIIGERGVKLSGGQRQRLGIARALYRDADILVLDEATSALDEETEKKVMNTIYSMKDTIVIMIAHRLSTIKNANKIIDLGEYGANRK